MKIYKTNQEFTILEEIDVTDISATNIKNLSNYGYFEITTYEEDPKYFVDIHATIHYAYMGYIYQTLRTNILKLLRERKINCLIDE